MQDFMEVFTATHFAYSLFIPLILVLIGLIFSIIGDVCSFNKQNIIIYIASVVFFILVISKVKAVVYEAPYIESHIEQFNFSNDKLKDLED